MLSSSTPSFPSNSPRYSALWVLIALLALYALFGGGMRGLWKPDEGRYTCVALNMLDSGNWLLPQLNDETPHFTKPPLTYWLLASSVKIFGRNEWALRFPNALAFIGTVLLVGAMARRFSPGNARLGALIYATSPFAYVAADLVTTDTLLTFFETLAMFGFVEYWFRREEKNPARWLWLMWGGFALTFMTKGPPGLLPLLPLLIFTGRQAGWRAMGRLFPWRGLLLFAVVGLSWYVVAITSKPGLLHYFIGSEVVGRIATDQFHRNGEWYGAIVAYAPTLLAGALPWLALALWARWKTHQSGEHKAHPETQLLLWWFFLMLTVFCIARSRLPLYVLPLFAPLALMMTQALAGLNWQWGKKQQWLVGGWIAFMCLIRIGGGFLPNNKDTRVLANEIKKQTGSWVKEVVFVNDTPDFGLRLYLNAQVERNDLKPDEDAVVETLADEIAHNESGQLFIVRDKDERRFLQTTPPTGKVWKCVGKCEKSDLLYKLDGK
jgi:4-amino-4-deoxy-L-arabinose transferase-like glycosyltransferase